MKTKEIHTRSDSELLQRALSGQKSDYELLYDRYSGSIYGFFLKMNRYNAPLAQDLTQDLFLKILEKGNQYDTSRCFKTWIFSIANNMCKNIYRHEAVIEKAQQHGITESRESTAHLENGIDKTRFSKELKIQLGRLDSAKRSSFILRFKHDLSIREIAEITEASEGTVKSRLHYTLKTLAERLSTFKDLIQK